MTKEALKLALEALESCDAAHITDGGHQWYDEKLVDKAITAIKEALAQPAPLPAPLLVQPEPQDIEQSSIEQNMQEFEEWSKSVWDARAKSAPPVQPVRQWVGLTDDELLQIRENVQIVEGRSLLQSLTKAIEQALKEKNHG